VLPEDNRRTAFAIQWRPSRFWVDYWQKKNIIIYDYDVYRFAEALEAKYVAHFQDLRARKD
jgi:hypothetical protein